MFCPRNVESPSDDPVGCAIPEGKGLLKVAKGVSRLSSEGTTELEALTPS